MISVQFKNSMNKDIMAVWLFVLLAGIPFIFNFFAMSKYFSVFVIYVLQKYRL